MSTCIQISVDVKNVYEIFEIANEYRNKLHKLQCSFQFIAFPWNGGIVSTALILCVKKLHHFESTRSR